MSFNTHHIESEKETFILEDAAETVYDRPDTHGEPEDSFLTISEKWTAHIRALLRSEDINPAGFSLDPADVANMMVDLKTSRNAEGHYHEDNYEDIAGYAENGARLESHEGVRSKVVIEDFDEKYTLYNLKKGDYPSGIEFTAVPCRQLRGEGYPVVQGPLPIQFILDNEDSFKFGTNYLFVPHERYLEEKK